jgi:hypothetical protein
MPHVLALTVALTVILLHSCCTQGKAKLSTRPFAIRHGRVIELQPSKARLTIPEEWIEWYKDHRNNIHLSRKELDAVRDAEGEWDADFADICNRTIPFAFCAFQAGGQGWGKNGGPSYGELQLRVYDIERSTKSMRDSVDAVMPEVKKRFDPKAAVLHRTMGEWHQSKISCYRRYGDYGATAIVDYRYRRAGSRLFVFVFMYTDFRKQEARIDSILNSFKTK